MKNIITFFSAVILFAACHKSSSNPNNNQQQKTDSSAKLQGNWAVVKYIAANFDTTNGKTPLPNDTIYPTHPESINITKDTIYLDSWETFSYYFAHPDYFTNTQTRQFLDTIAYTAAAGYLLEQLPTFTDTVYIVSLSDTTLVTMEKIYNNLSPGSGFLYDVYRYSKKQ